MSLEVVVNSRGPLARLWQMRQPDRGWRGRALVILFLFALFLAWPTAGLSLVAYCAFALLRLYLKTKANTHAANERLAAHKMSSGEKLVPSWAGTRSENEIFVDGIQRGAMRHGVPRVFLQGVLLDQETFETLVYYAGAMESEGASFVEQQLAVSDKLVEIWERAPENVRRECLN